MEEGFDCVYTSFPVYSNPGRGERYGSELDLAKAKLPLEQQLPEQPTTSKEGLTIIALGGNWNTVQVGERYQYLKEG